ncbi:hypothetical protein MBLL_04744 (plasmid) [Methylobacterium bullatum]|uniref:Uncharacterized protein n=1 Tax=Methylobacterium bullatum TaxID=570505 RepID=A0A679K0T2_9HYPH|nr:hypothetical protein MBLL_04744 [Methylobacterium bullatum]
MRETLVPFWGVVLGSKSETLVPFCLGAPHPLSHVSELQSQRMVLPFSWSQRLALSQAGQAAPAVLIPTPCSAKAAGSATAATFEDDKHDWTEYGRAECRIIPHASHPRMPARRGGLLARALVGTRSSHPSRRRLIPSPHPVLDARTTVQRGREIGVEIAEGCASTSPSPCPLRPRSTMGWRGCGRARTCSGSLGPAGSVLAVHGPLVRSRDRIAAGRSRGACAARALRVSGGRENAVSVRLTAPTVTRFRRVA